MFIPEIKKIKCGAEAMRDSPENVALVRKLQQHGDGYNTQTPGRNPVLEPGADGV